MKKYVFLFLMLIILCSCPEQQDGNVENFDVYITTKLKSPKVTFYNSQTGEKSQSYELKYISDAADSFKNYGTYGDSEKYDMLTVGYDFTNKAGTTFMESMKFSFNKYVNALYINSMSKAMPYEYGKSVITPKFETVSLVYDETKDILKKIFIWTPESYNGNDIATKYNVIYMTDGQNLFKENSTNYGSWGVAQAVTAMMSKSDKRAIVVGIDDGDGNRDSELTPNLGKNLQTAEFNNGTGKKFASFVVETVMPYINEHYNVFTDCQHTSVCGSSSGGLEAFYIGMTYANKFGAIGALSPAFLIFGQDDWDKYLDGLDLSENVPFIYMYCGKKSGLENELYIDTQKMITNLQGRDYPEDKLHVYIWEEADHNESYWRAVFPDFLKYSIQ